MERAWHSVLGFVLCVNGHECQQWYRKYEVKVLEYLWLPEERQKA